MQLIKYNPFREVQKIQRDLNKLWDQDMDFFPLQQDWSTMDMYEENGNVVAEFTMPNFTKKEISVTTENDMLEITAEHEEKDEEKKNRRYYRRESSNRFWRRVALPEGVKNDKIEANYSDGVLTVKMPIDKKAIAAKKRSVPIN